MFGSNNNKSDLLIIEIKLLALNAFHNKITDISKLIICSKNNSIKVRNQIFSPIEMIINKKSLKDNVLIKQLLYTMTFDRYYLVRGNAIYYLSMILKKDIIWNDIFYNRIKEMEYDSNSYVRDSILHSIKKINKEYRENYKHLVIKFKRDPHSKVRKHAIKVYNKLFKV